MGKALTAVGAFLAFCFLVFGGVVFLTRSEDRVAVDNLLAERLGRAVVEAGQQDRPLDLREVTPFDWDEVLVYRIGTPREEVSQALGFEFRGDLQYTVESSLVFVFTNRGRFVKFADYRGRATFAGLEEPIDRFTAGEAVFDVSDGVVRPAGA